MQRHRLRVVDVAAALHIEAVLGQIDAQALMQHPALADQPCPAVYLYALQQPQNTMMLSFGWLMLLGALRAWWVLPASLQRQT